MEDPTEKGEREPTYAEIKAWAKEQNLRELEEREAAGRCSWEKEEPPESPDDILATAEVAGLYGVSAQTIQTKIRKGELRAAKVEYMPHRWRYEIRRGDLDPEWLERHEMTTAELREYYGDDFDGPHSEKDLLSPAQVATLWGKHRLTIYRYIKDGSLPAIRDARGHYKIRRGDLPRLYQCPPGAETVEEKAREKAARRRAKKRAKDKGFDISPDSEPLHFDLYLLSHPSAPADPDDPEYQEWLREKYWVS